jgi:hypothetical protein
LTGHFAENRLGASMLLAYCSWPIRFVHKLEGPRRFVCKHSLTDQELSHVLAPSSM